MRSVSERLAAGEGTLAVVGLGYVGLPLAVAFAKHFDVIGFDVNERKIETYRSGVDPTMEAGDDAVARSGIRFTSDPAELKRACMIVVAVPTPINGDKMPDLSPVIGATELVGRNLSEGTIVVYESTVYPGVTEDECVPVLERESGLSCGRDFKVGYSPERINPGDKVHTLATITKVVSGMDDWTLDEVARIYDKVVEAGTHRVSCIKAAEAVKLIENSQRDINIAFMNEAAMVFDRLGIDTNEVVDGMNTKWNALGFRPGLVGGHCIGVDPYYFVYEAGRLGYVSQVISSGRAVNDFMGTYVADVAIKKMVRAGLSPARSKVAILGFTFKENCPDFRNTRVLDIVKRLDEYGIEPVVVDPWADPDQVRAECGVELAPIEDARGSDCLIHAVSHDDFKQMGMAGIAGLLKDAPAPRLLLDVKGCWPIAGLEAAGIDWWRL